MASSVEGLNKNMGAGTPVRDELFLNNKIAIVTSCLR